MNRVLVTGATGFIGQQLCKALNEMNIEVHTLGRKKPECESIFHYWDLKTAIDGIMPNDIDVIFHLAGKAHVLSNDYHDEEEYFPVNLGATRKLLNAAKSKGIQKFIYFSSVKAMGEDSEQQLDESCTLLPQDMYGRSKLMAEQLVLDGDYVPHPVVIRPCMVYGNSDKGNLPKMIQAISQGKFPPLPETDNRRSMVHVDDIVSAALLAAQHPQAANIYIVSDGQAYSTRQIYLWINQALGKRPPVWHVPVFILKVIAKVGDFIGWLLGRRFIFDSDALDKLIGSADYTSDRIEREMGFKAKRDLQESLPEIVAFLGLSK